MKAWLKGGLIIGFLYSIISLFIIISYINKGLAGLLAVAVTYPTFFIIRIIFNSIRIIENFNTIVYISWVFNTLFFFLIGSLIGLTFNKLEIKFNKKNIIIGITVTIILSVLIYLFLSWIF